MSLRLSVAAVRTYDTLKSRPGGDPRRSGARDARAIEALDVRLKELVAAFRVNGHQERGSTYVFWSDISREIEAGSFDDLLVLL